MCIRTFVLSHFVIRLYFKPLFHHKLEKQNRNPWFHITIGLHFVFRSNHHDHHDHHDHLHHHDADVYIIFQKKISIIKHFDYFFP